MTGRSIGYDRLRWLAFRNETEETIPPFAILRITGVVAGDPGRLVLAAAKPNTYGSQWSHYVNGRLPIPAGREGLCAVPEGPILAGYAPGTPPAVNESWGPRDDSWTLHQHIGGFRILDVLEDDRVLVIREPLLDIRVSLDEDLESGKTADATPFYWSGTEWTATGMTVSVREFMGVDNDLVENTICTARWIPGAGFCVIAAGCQ